jgi:hypothetical protein
LNGILIEHNSNFKSIPFDNPFPVIPENKQTTTTTTTISNYLDNVNLDEFGSSSSLPFFNGITTSNIPNILNTDNNKNNDYTKFPVINKILEFRKMQNMLGDGLCGYYAILSQFKVVYSGNTLGPYNNNEEIKFAAKK